MVPKKKLREPEELHWGMFKDVSAFVLPTHLLVSDGKVFISNQRGFFKITNSVQGKPSSSIKMGDVDVDYIQLDMNKETLLSGHLFVMDNGRHKALLFMESDQLPKGVERLKPILLKNVRIS